jgi:neutral ceramidase
MHVGFARVDITPPVASQTDMYVPILGWPGERGKLVDAVRDPLYAKALAVSDGERRAVVVSCDSLGDHVGYSEPARQMIAGQTGLDDGAIIILATHAHTTPETCDIGDRPVDPRWVAEMSDRVARCAMQAIDGMQQVRLVLIRRSVAGLNANRRRPDRPCDQEMSVLLASDEAGEPIGALVAFAAHPTTVQVHPYYSADYVGHAMALVEAAMPDGFVGVFVNGCCGDVRPEAPESEAGLVQQGDAVGKAALNLIGSIRAGEGVRLDGPVRSAVRQAAVQRQPLPELGTTPPLPNGRGSDGRRGIQHGCLDEKRRTERAGEVFYLDEKIALARGPASWKLPIRGLAIGELRLVVLPCEPLARVGLHIQSNAPGMTPIVLGYADPMMGYVGMQADYDEGGYESIPSRWARLGPGSGEAICDTALAVLEELDRG